MSEKRVGTVDLSDGVPRELKQKLEKTKMPAEDRARYCGDSMWGMYNFTAIRALMLADGDWARANETCIQVEKLLTGFSAAAFYEEHEAGSPADVAMTQPMTRAGIADDFRATSDARNAATADIIIMMNSYSRANYRVLKWTPEEAVYQICDACPRKDSLDAVTELSRKRGMPSPLDGYDLFSICAAGAEGYAMAMPGVLGEARHGMCRGDDVCEFRYYLEEDTPSD